MVITTMAPSCSTFVFSRLSASFLIASLMVDSLLAKIPIQTNLPDPQLPAPAGRVSVVSCPKNSSKVCANWCDQIRNPLDA